MLPYGYDRINADVGLVSPSTVHASNTALSRYFRKYLMQKAMSVFKFVIPDWWSKEYFLYTLYGHGFIAIVNTNKFGVICQQCGLMGYDVFYRPTNATIVNPLLRGILNPVIGSQCVLLKLQPDYGSVMDIVGYYADMLALCAETAGMNIVNSKLSYVFATDGKAKGESFKKMFDQIQAGNPATVIDKALFNESGEPMWQAFQQNVGENFIAGDVLEVMRKIECMFATDIGIPNANTEKKERLIQKEVESNTVETMTRCEMWLEEMQKTCEQANKMFPDLRMSVDWRNPPRKESDSNVDIINPRDV